MKTEDAATLAGVSEATIRQWKRRGHLPDVFDARDVWRCTADRMSRREHARLDALWEQVRDAHGRSLDTLRCQLSHCANETGVSGGRSSHWLPPTS